MRRLGGAVLWLLLAVPTPGLGQTPAPGTPQVTLFGILAEPGSKTIDKELRTVAPQLQRLLPNHGFKLLGSQSRPLPVGQTVSCPLGEGWSAEATMVIPQDVEGKVNLRVTIHHVGEPSFQRIIRTPPNQLFFSDIALPNGNRIVIGMGAR
ncbi:MAG: hypothetical protein U0800_21135 [Isosphaeraceae bacterium]